MRAFRDGVPQKIVSKPYWKHSDPFVIRNVIKHNRMQLMQLFWVHQPSQRGAAVLVQPTDQQIIHSKRPALPPQPNRNQLDRFSNDANNVEHQPKIIVSHKLQQQFLSIKKFLCFDERVSRESCRILDLVHRSNQLLRTKLSNIQNKVYCYYKQLFFFCKILLFHFA